MANTVAGNRVTALSDKILEYNLTNESLSSNHVNDKQRDWLVDLGASSHITSNTSNLHEVSSSNRDIERMVHSLNRKTTSISHIGSCRLPTGDILNNVLVVPDFKFDLLSVS